MPFTVHLRDLFAWLGGGAVVLTVLRYFAKLVVERWLRKRDESQKAERQAELESHKAELVRLTEQLKHGLEREMLKAQLSTSKVHQIYPILYERILRAHSAVADLTGGRMEPTYEDYSTQDFIELLERRHLLPQGERALLLKNIATDREKGIQKLRHVLRRVEIQHARGLLIKASNYRVVKGLYLSEPVGALAYQILNAVNDWLSAINVEFRKPGARLTGKSPSEMEKLSDKIEELRQLMSKELQPKELQT